MSTETTKYKYENSGPWDSEPDRVEWVDEATGLACLIIRTEHSGALCGYVGLPQGHSLHGIEYDNINVRVHGGLTYSAIGDGEFRPAGLWWVGFDCCHCWDAYPAQRHGWRDANATYKDIDYVRSETAKLAAQLGAFGEMREALQGAINDIAAVKEAMETPDAWERCKMLLGTTEAVLNKALALADGKKP